VSTDSYLVYVRTYGKLASMGRLTDDNYRGLQEERVVELAAEIQVAISIAAQDVSLGQPMRSKKDFRDELGRLLG
jgi:hypothetical protein